MDANTHMTAEDFENQELLRLTADVVASFVSYNKIDADHVPDLVKSVHNTMTKLGQEPEKAEKQKPAVAISRSVKPDYIVCLEDGKKLKMLKRHLMAVYGMTPDEYRAKWNLPSDYPMTAPNYAKKRSEFARKIGLGKTTGGRKKKAKA